jgi:hypothetical protein
VTVDTGGGDLQAGKIKAVAAYLMTHGGSITGSVTAGGARSSGRTHGNGIHQAC